MALCFRRILKGIFVFSFVSVFVLQDSFADTYRVYGVRSWDKLNIRSAPSTRGSILGSIPPYGSGIEMLGPCRGTWCPIQYRNVTGWASGRYLVREAPDASPLRVTGIAGWDVLYIRSKPSTRGKKIGSIPPDGRGVSKLGPCKANWCRISYRGTIGWASMMYLIPDTEIPIPSQTRDPELFAQPGLDGPVQPAPPPGPDFLEGLEDPI